MALAEAFTILAVLEATDKMSRVLERVDGSLNQFSETASRTAAVSAEAGAKIDESLLQTASGADAVELADARLAAAREKLTAATAKQAEAERALLDTRASVASEEELAVAADAVAAAQERAAVAATALATAQETLKVYEKEKVDADLVAAATERVAVAQGKATAATAELTAAQQRQAALVTSEDAAKAADALTAAQKRSTAATRDVTAAEAQQAAVGRAAALSTVEGRAAADEAAASQARLAEQQARAATGSAALSKGMKFGALAVAAVGYESIKAAGNFESMTEHLVTDAGESQQNIGMIRSGMLALATATGTTTDQMAAGMYHVESAGFHGQKALDVLKVAAEGAKVGGADLDTIGQALTGTMNAFGESGGTATQMMNAMIATVGAGDMKMEAFGSSLGNVAAIGASAKLSFAQVAGAVSTMTAQNVSAQRATQDLAHTIGSLGNPTAVQTKEMTAMGVDSLKLSSNLGKNGLTGTFDILVRAIAAHTKGGAVMVNTLNASKAAAAQANAVLGQMPATMKKMAQGWQAGTTSTAEFNKAIQALPPSQQKMYTQFELLTKKSSSFATSLQANTPMAQTFNAALAKMTGGTTSLNTILMLSGQHAETFKDNVATISAAAHKSGSEVDNWSAIQSTFNQKMDVAKASMEAAGISIGTALLPAVSAIAGVIAQVVGPMATWISQHQKWVGLGLAVAGAIMTVVAAMKAWEAVQTVMNVLAAIFAAEETAILSPIELVVIAIAALVAGLVYAYFHFKVFRDVVNEVFSVVKTIVMTYIHLIVLEIKLLVEASIAVWHALVATWNAIVGAAKAVWNWLAGIWNNIYNTTMAVWNAITGFFSKWWPLLLVIFMPFIAVVMALWNHFHQDIFDAAKTTWNAITSFFSGVWHFITSTAQSAWNLFKKYVLTPIQLIWTEMQGPIRSVEKFLSDTWNTIKAAAAFIWLGIKAGIINPVLDIWHTIVNTFNQVKAAITGKLTDAWNAVKGIGGKFLSIGSSIVEGIIKGIEGGAGSLLNTIENMANNALGGALSFLGINSPSKVFADRVGMAIPEGVAKGVNDHAHLAHKAVTDMAGALSSAAAHTVFTGGVSLSGASAGLAYAGGGGSGGSITLTLDLRGAVVSNQQAMQQLADKVGQSITTQLARAGVHIRA